MYTQLLFNYLKTHDLDILFFPEEAVYAGERICTGPEDTVNCYGPIMLNGEVKYLDLLMFHMT